MPRQYIYNGRFCLDCGKRVQKQTIRCRPCHFAWLRANPQPQPLKKRRFNEVRIEGDTAFIILTNRAGTVIAEAAIDTSDLAIVSDRRWSFAGTGYACTQAVQDGRPVQIFLHRMLMGMSRGDGKMVDHIDRDPLNNRRSNLRPADPITNAANRDRPSSSRRPGVTWCKQTESWAAQLIFKGQKYFMGRHPTEDAAFVAYQLKRKELGLPPAPDYV